MISREQAQALTRVVHLLRPGWNEEGIYAALGKVAQREPFDVALAALRAAADPKAKTPGVIPSPGPHWNELEPKAPAVPHLPRAERRARTCATCGRMDDQHDDRDHRLIPLDRASGHRSPDGAARVRAELAAARTEPAPTSEETA